MSQVLYIYIYKIIFVKINLNNTQVKSVYLSVRRIDKYMHLQREKGKKKLKMKIK